MKIRLILLVTCLAIVGVIAATGYRAYLLEAELSGRALAEAIFQNSELAAVEAETRQLLAAASDAAIAHLDDPGACSQELQTLTRVHPLYAALAVFSPEGALLCSGPARWLTRPDDRLLRLAAMSDGFAVGEFTIAEGINRKILPFALPLYNGPRLIGFAVTVIELDSLTRRLARSWRQENAIITVADRSANILVRLPHSASWVGRRLPDEMVALLDLPTAGIAKLAMATGDRVEALGYVPLAPAPRDLFVSVGFQTNTVLGEIKRSLRKSILPVTVVFLAAGLLVVLLQARRE
jgi:hypothetical protein